MGYNTTVIVNNDALNEIRDDKNFGEKVYNAALGITNERKPIGVDSGCHCSAATVIETHHADRIKLIAVGGNYATDLGDVGNYSATPEAMLKSFAESLGYRVVKKSKKA
jgi:hypothetical protein